MRKSVIILAVLMFLAQGVFAATPDEISVNLLKGNFDDAIHAASGLSSVNSSNVKMYYLVGLAYLKKKNYEKSRYYLEQVSQLDGADKKIKLKARIAFADTYFLEQKFQDAMVLFESLLKEDNDKSLRPLLFLRAAQCSKKSGKWKEGSRYLDNLRSNYPNSLELQAAASLQSVEYFCVQVGSFSNEDNAKKFVNLLKTKGFNAYISGVNMGKGAIYRVRVGQSESRPEAEELRESLDRLGYKTRIYP